MSALNNAARRVLLLADQEARRFRHDYIGTEHLLLALVRLPGGVAARVLARLGIAPGQVRGAVEAVVRINRQDVPEGRSLTPRARQVLDYAGEAARARGQPQAGTGHLLLGLLEVGESVAQHVLHELGAGQPARDVAGLVAAESSAGPDAERPEEPLPELAPEALRARAEVGPLGGEVEVPLPQSSVLRPVETEDRAGPLLLGAGMGALRGFSWSLLVAGPLVLLLWRSPAQGGWQRALGVAGLTMLVWVFCSAVSGALRAREEMLEDHYDVLVRRHTRQAVSRTLLFLTPLALLLLSIGWDHAPASAVLLTGTVLAIGIVTAALVGFAQGTKAAEEQQQRDSESALAFVASDEAAEKLARWDADTLAQRRMALQHAIEARFGPLVEDARERLQRWDQDQVAEAGERLTRAGSLDELGLQN